MKIEYNDLLTPTITADGRYDHKFTMPKLRRRVLLRNWFSRTLNLHRAGYGWVFTRRQANQVVIKMLNEKGMK